MDAFKIPLDGSNYVSKERKENFEKALQDDHQVTINRQPSSAQDPERNPEISSEDLGKVSRESESPAQGGNHLLESINLGLSNSFAHQTRTMEVHEQYLEQQGEFAQVFIHILEQGEKLLENSQNGGGERLLESLHQRLDQFQHLQEKGLEVHQQFLGQQADYSQSFVQLLEQQHQVLHQGGNGSASVQKRIDTLDLTSRPAPQRTAAPETPAARQAGGPPAAEQPERSGAGHPAEFPPEKSELTPVPLEELTAVLLEVVGEKTGYPPEMLEMEMDMEADLGIDSIKRVEILGTMEEKYPDLPQPEPDALAELRTLQEIVSYLSREVEGGPDPEPAPSAAPGTAAPVGGDPDPIEKPSAADQSPDVDELTTLLLDVVAEKTGYPAEMLELEMDMEADLGIDSIKRVEILGSMEEQVPELPAFETDKLADLRTLGQIVDYMKQGSPGQEPAGSKEKKKVDTSSLNTEVVRLQPLPEPDFYSFSPPTDRPLIITDDGTTMSADLASRLALSGWHVVLWRYPTNLINTGEGALPDELPVVESAGSDLQQLSEQLARVVQQYGEPAGFIHLHPDSGEDETFSNTDRELVKQVFFLAKHLDPYLNREQAEGRNLFITITQNGGKLGLNGQESFSQSSGLPGLIKTLRWEWSQVFCRSLDLAVDLPKEEKLSAVIQEIHDPDRSLTEIGISQDGRVTISKEPLHA
ncbi:MAG: phosphopantetheine-binding protein [Anaerolineales bacterium]|nr:phosphopantetheine-binding protein [Anaerolineales bacterium]